MVDKKEGRQNSGDVIASMSNDQNAPFTIFDQERQATLNAATARTQHLRTFLWL
jgi:uncharacterized alpha-E superfamily protein